MYGKHNKLEFKTIINIVYLMLYVPLVVLLLNYCQPVKQQDVYREQSRIYYVQSSVYSGDGEYASLLVDEDGNGYTVFTDKNYSEQWVESKEYIVGSDIETVVIFDIEIMRGGR